MKRFLVVIGTRPEAVKLAPVVHALESRGAVADILLTGQQEGMLNCCLAVLGLKAEHRLVGINASDHSSADSMVSRLSAFTRDIARRLDRPSVVAYDGVVVVGDTISAMAGALAGSLSGVPVAHVEAGLRTYAREPWPEETIRRSIAAMATWNFAPTAAAESNLWGENFDPGSTWLVGNTVVDSLRRFGAKRLKARSQIVVVTLHRRENWPAMRSLAETISNLAEKHPHVLFHWPVHPNAAVSGPVHDVCGDLDPIKLWGPLDYEAFLQALCSASLVITDSGGVQEEAAVLGVPTLVVRENTERSEAIEAGVSRLVSADDLFSVADELLSDPEKLQAMDHTTDAFGDGRAGERIADILLTGQTPIGELS